MPGDTIVVFVSDHGELLGHYGMLIKSIDEYPMLYDVGLKVPLIIQTPLTASNRGITVDTAVELVDIFPTLLEAADIDIPAEVQGESLIDSMRGGAAPKRDYIYAETGAVKMIRGERYKLVHYPGQEYGELYDIVDDPSESKNRFTNPEYQKIKERLTRDLLDRLIGTEGALHGESMRGPAYWKTMHQLPFAKL